MVFDFFTIKRARVQTWGNVRHSYLHVTCKHCFFMEMHISWLKRGFPTDANALTLMCVSAYLLTLGVFMCVWGDGVIYEGADL